MLDRDVFWPCKTFTRPLILKINSKVSPNLVYKHHSYDKQMVLDYSNLLLY